MKKVGSIPVSDAQMQEALAGKAEGGNYFGAGDNMLDFGKGKSFIDEEDSAKTFQLIITNTGTETASISLCPGSENVPENIKDSSGVAVDCIMKEGVMLDGDTKKLSAKGTPRSIDEFVKYIRNHPVRLLSFRIKVDKLDQLDEALILRSETPWGTAVEERRLPVDYQTEKDNYPNIVKITDVRGWILSCDTTLLYKVQRNSSVTLTFYCGASLDTTQALVNKASEAETNAAVLYARQSSK